ncbi:hypothetical protein N7603_02535 [Acholeplasma vituli]|uniref:Zinc finger/thioredoxin putative domain-containing protein n=1 Tax=Paracholeplasma vituli TaxID=69473 RepID=A0ABT2PXT5_9MOLU|nr:hypothetical protein [Paracholeplasma vituli]MCU0104527.1 hypothetical protein [Paracholeplasma vituli]
MKCYQCRKHFYPRRTLSTLFEEPLQLRCKSCEKRYPVRIKREVIPISNYQLYLYTLFIEEVPIKEEAYLDESLKVLLLYLNHRKQSDILIWIETLDKTLYECLDQLDLCDIFIISLFPHKLMV